MSEAINKTSNCFHRDAYQTSVLNCEIYQTLMMPKRDKLLIFCSSFFWILHFWNNIDRDVDRRQQGFVGLLPSTASKRESLGGVKALFTPPNPTLASANSYVSNNQSHLLSWKGYKSVTLQPQDIREKPKMFSPW